MSVLGRRRIVETPDHTEDYPDIMEPAFILFNNQGSGEFAFGGRDANFIARNQTSSAAC